VAVDVEVAVDVVVTEGVAVGVDVAVAVGVRVGVDVAVDVGVAVGVSVTVGVDVGKAANTVNSICTPVPTLPRVDRLRGGSALLLPKTTSSALPRASSRATLRTRNPLKPSSLFGLQGDPELSAQATRSTSTGVPGGISTRTDEASTPVTASPTTKVATTGLGIEPPGAGTISSRNGTEKTSMSPASVCAADRISTARGSLR